MQAYILTVSLGVAILLSAPILEGGPKIRVIDGRKTPELIPEDLRWEFAMQNVVDFARNPEDGELSASSVDGLSRNALFVPISDAQTIVRVAQRTLQRVDELRGPLDREHDSGVDLGWSLEQRLEALARARRAVLEGRDELARTLPRKSFRAFRRWVDQGAFSTKRLLTEVD